MRSVPDHQKTSAVIFLAYCAAHPHPPDSDYEEDARPIDGPDSTAAIKTETGSEDGGKDTNAPQQVMVRKRTTRMTTAGMMMKIRSRVTLQRLITLHRVPNFL